MYIHVYVHDIAYLYIPVHTYNYNYIFVYTCKITYLYIPAHTWYVHVLKSMYMYVHVYTCYIHVCTILPNPVHMVRIPDEYNCGETTIRDRKSKLRAQTRPEIARSVTSSKVNTDRPTYESSLASSLPLRVSQ
jgi:hypothetical protein